MPKDVNRYKSGRPVVSSERKLILDLYKLGYSRQLIGSTLRSQGIRIDNNSIQTLINEQKNKMSKAFYEHQKEVKLKRKSDYQSKINTALSVVSERKYRNLINKVEVEYTLPELEDIVEDEGASTNKTQRKMEDHLMNALKKTLSRVSPSSPHSAGGYPIMAYINFERPVKYAGRRQKTAVIEKGIGEKGTKDAEENLRDVQKIQEDFGDEGVYSEVYYWSFLLHNWVDVSYVRNWVNGYE